MPGYNLTSVSLGAAIGGFVGWACCPSKKNKAACAVGGAVVGGVAGQMLTGEPTGVGAIWDSREVRDANKAERLRKAIARKSEKLAYLDDLQASPGHTVPGQAVPVLHPQYPQSNGLSLIGNIGAVPREEEDIHTDIDEAEEDLEYLQEALRQKRAGKGVAAHEVRAATHEWRGDRHGAELLPSRFVPTHGARYERRAAEREAKSAQHRVKTGRQDLQAYWDEMDELDALEARAAREAEMEEAQDARRVGDIYRGGFARDPREYEGY